MADNPWELISRSQRAAAGLVVDSATAVVAAGKAGITHPERTLEQLTELLSAVGDLAGSSVQPLEAFLASQRQLAETVAAFAVLQRQLAEVMDTAAANHAAMVDALEALTAPVLGVAHRLRHEQPADGGDGGA